MTQFPKMQARFDAALEIIEGDSGGDGNAADTEKLAKNLAAAEKTANTASDVAKAAQAEAASASEALQKARERVDALEKEVASGADGAEAQRAAMIKQIDALDKARQYNKHLKKLNTSLRKANEDNVGDPELINASLVTELEQIKAQRDIDLEEVNGILARLTPLVEGA